MAETTRIEFVGFRANGKITTDESVVHGYSAGDYLPGYSERCFASAAEAEAWIAANHRGPDGDGVDALFETVEG